MCACQVASLCADVTVTAIHALPVALVDSGRRSTELLFRTGRLAAATQHASTKPAEHGYGECKPPLPSLGACSSIGCCAASRWQPCSLANYSATLGNPGTKISPAVTCGLSPSLSGCYSRQFRHPPIPGNLHTRASRWGLLLPWLETGAQQPTGMGAQLHQLAWS